MKKLLAALELISHFNIPKTSTELKSSFIRIDGDMVEYIDSTGAIRVDDIDPLEFEEELNLEFHPLYRGLKNIGSTKVKTNLDKVGNLVIKGKSTQVKIPAGGSLPDFPDVYNITENEEPIAELVEDKLAEFLGVLAMLEKTFDINASRPDLKNMCFDESCGYSGTASSMTRADMGIEWKDTVVLPGEFLLRLLKIQPEQLSIYQDEGRVLFYVLKDGLEIFILSSEFYSKFPFEACDDFLNKEYDDEESLEISKGIIEAVAAALDVIGESKINIRLKTSEGRTTISAKLASSSFERVLKEGLEGAGWEILMDGAVALQALEEGQKAVFIEDLSWLRLDGEDYSRVLVNRNED